MFKKFENFQKWFIEKINSKPLPKSRQKAFKQQIIIFFQNYNEKFFDTTINIPIKLGITNFEFREYKDFFQIKITLLRPGLLIGKGGSTINFLSKRLSDMYNKKVKIEIEESKIWN